MNTPTNVLHLYRRLLRAVTYLPDSFARDYAHKHIVDQFRRNAKRFNPKPIVSNRVKKAKYEAISLERAGNGGLEDLKRVLLSAYGRRGRRRRELIQDLLRPDEAVLPKDDTALKQLIYNPNGEEAINHEPSPKVTAFIASQENHHPLGSPRPKIRKLKIPKTNIWGRPIPKKSEVSLRKKWWAATLDRLLPPVPRHEWDRLRDLALGKIPLDEFPKRRSRKEEPVADREEEMRVIRYLQHSLRSEAAKSEGIIFDSNLGLITQVRDCKELDQLSGKPLLNSPRALRRLYASIWTLTPTMSQDEVTKKWNVQWGSGKSPLLAGIVTKPSASDMELFEGIESQPNPQPQSQVPDAHRRRVDELIKQDRAQKANSAII
jgi:hypothetical protein